MYILQSKISIGKYQFSSITEVEISKSVEELMDTAIIKMPTKFKLRNGKDYLNVENAIKVGDKVKIELGYEDKYTGVEFEGYVAQVSCKIPMEIKCEDAMWLLRRKNINKAYGKTTLKEILQEVVKGTEIILSDKIPNMPIDKWIIQNANGTQVLQKLKEDFGLSIYLENDNKLYAGLQQLTQIGKEALYNLNYNLASNNLEYKSADQKKIKVKYECRDKANKVIKVELGDDGGEVREKKFNCFYNENELRKLAEETLKGAKYDGFEGSVTSFLIPYSTPGMAAHIEDGEHPAREGKYFIKKVQTTFGSGGARREISISNKL